MQLKHSLSIFSTNLNLTYKVLIFIFIILIIALAFFVSIFTPVIKDIRAEIELEGASLAPRDILEDPVTELTKIWHIVSDFLSDNYMLLVTRFLFLGLLLVFARFFVSLAFVPISMIIYNRMTTGYSGGLFSSMVSTFPQTIVFAFFSSIIYSIIDLAIAFLSLYAFFFFYKLVNISAFMPAFAIFILLFSLRISAFSHWLAVICDGEKNIFKALGTALKSSAKSISTHYPIVLTITVTYFAIITCTLLPTFSIFPIVTFPMFIIILCITNLVSYFNFNQRKYYTDLGKTVFTPDSK